MRRALACSIACAGLLFVNVRLATAAGEEHGCGHVPAGSSEEATMVPAGLQVRCVGQAYEQFPGLDQDEERIASVDQCISKQARKALKRAAKKKKNRVKHRKS